jgi:hypothetical protein
MTHTNLARHLASGGQQSAFKWQGAMQTAHWYHNAADELEAIHQQSQPRKTSRVYIDCIVMLYKTSIGRRLVGLVYKGLNFARRFLFRPKPVNVDQNIGRVAGAVVLEALAIELVLKARLKRSEIDFQGPLKGIKRHDHAKLFALLPDIEKQQADQRYRSLRHPAIRATLAEALDFSAKVFTEWRYMHEQPSGVQASMGEMQRAFKALTEGM